MFDANGELAYVGQAMAASDGIWEINLEAAVTNALPAGSNLLEVVVVSNLVALPVSQSVQFVTAP